ncbi:hypothetical protein LEP1GSC008_1335 [Leptospira kirschneri serovar Bulgarica str. Nikolaevo]|uniref:Uncharacterized protein n=1 Tax=Leptospira kirschneri serovar Bulgarica str. Nikolaevo TaxID=1240687 RepID=M6FBH2_9LEPT|nr:hypothetical protein LEP1GSC008_1335 [Leptospira kirschneri serovar Bulgarica str. Nikolaevo]
MDFFSTSSFLIHFLNKKGLRKLEYSTVRFVLILFQSEFILNE